ncbi:hypothetical protein [Halomonas shengliensis]|uniref:hypothetical protein n=1 Tax=Halomonas shengliensis TaxID=419597 RepID=UPI001C4091CC|nr:hypothetical protein [Halomonas shengliensis]
MLFLPSTSPSTGLWYSQVQWRVAITSSAASVWQPRQASVTSSPLAKGPSSASN